MGNVQVSTPAIGTLLTAGVPVIYLSMGGQFRGILQPGFPKNAVMRLAQYEAALNHPLALCMAREIVRAKITAEEKTLERWRHNRWGDTGEALEQVRTAASKLEQASDLAAILGVEASAAKAYFQGLGETAPPPFCWEGRNRQPPRDPINALLSLTYMMTLGRIVAVCFACGLDPHIGFLHQLDYGRPSLALDILEPLRAWYCDRFVMRLLQAEVFDLDDFTRQEAEGCRLRPDMFARYLAEYEEYFSKPHTGQSGFPGMLENLARRLTAGIKASAPPAWAEMFE